MLKLEVTDFLTIGVQSIPANSSRDFRINNPISSTPKAIFLNNTSGMVDGVVPVFCTYASDNKIVIRLMNVTGSAVSTLSTSKVKLAIIY